MMKPLGNGTFLVRTTLTINGKRKERKRICKTKQEAIFWKKKFSKELVELQKQQEVVEPRTWRRCLEDYFEYAQENLSAGAYYNRKTCLLSFTSDWMDRDLEKISTLDVDAVVNSESFSVAYKKDILKFIRLVYDFNIGLRKTNFNPCKMVKVKFDKSELDEAKILKAMTSSEVQILLDHVRKCDENWFCIFSVTYFLGLRYSEALELKFSDIDFNRRLVTISRSWCKKKRGSVPPKNGLSRKVPISPSLTELLLKLSDNKAADDFVLPRVRMWVQGMGAKVLNVFQTDLGIKKSNYHSLRASFITHLLNKGTPLIKVQAMVGHSDLKTTQRYIRLDASDLDGATDVLDSDYVR